MVDAWTSAEPVVVLIEDEHAESERVRDELAAAGFRVMTIGNGPDALRVIEAERGRIGAVVAEVALPALGGREIAELLAERHPSVPVIRVRRTSAATTPVSPALDTANLKVLIARLRTVTTCSPLPHPRTGTAAPYPSRNEGATFPAIVCPECASARVASILYGAARLDRREEVATGRVILGGAACPPNGPTQFCRDCEHRWSA